MSDGKRPTAAPVAPRSDRRFRILRLVPTLEGEAYLDAFSKAVREGLLGEPKMLPWSYFYDEEGSRLFDAICDLPEYYLTRVEEQILRRHAASMVDTLWSGSPDGRAPSLVELGSGSAVKTERLIAAAFQGLDRLHYVPIEISNSALEASARRLVQRYPSLRVTGYVADYRRGLERIAARFRGPRLILFLGSSLGNYGPEEAVELLQAIGRSMRSQDRLLLGTDLLKDPVILEAAYDDSRGVTASFNRNLLRRMNRELGSDFDLASFEHRVRVRSDLGRVEMHLVSKREQEVSIPRAGLRIHLAEGESIHTENSYKYTPGSLATLAAEAGFVEEAAWTDSRLWYRVQRWRLRTGAESQGL